MASNLKNLNEHLPLGEFDFSRFTIAIVVSEWNEAITTALYEGCIAALTEYKIADNQITTLRVPGTFELPAGAQMVAKNVSAVVCLGAVIQGETPHFDFICQAAANGVMQLGLMTQTPIVFGVLTTLTEAQAFDRAGGKHGNKGYEGGITALKMIKAKEELRINYPVKPIGF